MKKHVVLVGVCLVALAGPAAATTWGPATVTCPVCGATNEFAEVMSYGSYIYGWPSRFQYLFWPRTDSLFLHTCTTCGYSAYMWDFPDLPADRRDEVAAALEGALPPGPWESYTDIPMPERLALAERAYRVLGRDDFFWCEYYRILGYHLDEAGRAEEAAAARRRALGIAVALAKKDEHAGRRKELLLITGAMRHFLGDDAGALADFQEALTLTFEAPDQGAEANANTDEGLTGLLQDYVVELGAAPGVESQPGGPQAPDAGAGAEVVDREDRTSAGTEEGEDAAVPGGGTPAVAPVPPTSRGCACSTPSPSSPRSSAWLLLVLAVAGWARRRG
jgi:MYXO-CTERM domain-containing protein